MKGLRLFPPEFSTTCLSNTSKSLLTAASLIYTWKLESYSGVFHYSKKFHFPLRVWKFI